VVGSYNRFDIFTLTVNRSARRPATFIDDRQHAAHGKPGDLSGHPPRADDPPFPAEPNAPSRKSEQFPQRDLVERRADTADERITRSAVTQTIFFRCFTAVVRKSTRKIRIEM